MDWMKRASLAALSLGGWAPLAAQDIPDGAGTAEFQYIETLIYARPAGLAGAYTSLARGADAVGYNPAGLSKLEGARSFSGTLRYSFLDVTSGNVTYAYPGASRTYAFSLAYVNYGHIQELDEEGRATGNEILPTSFNPSFTAAGRFAERLRYGVTARGLSEYLGDFEGSQLAWGWGVDLGLQYQPDARNVGFGLSLLNLGRKQAAHFTGGESGGMLPASLKAGFFYYPLDLPKGRLALDLEVPWYDSPLVSGGLEYAYTPNFMLRVGSRLNWAEARHYFLKLTDQERGEFAGGNALKLAGGFSFEGEGIAVDYAVQYWLALNWVHALTLRFALPGG